ncbi:MAG: ankyrin repeat domain-containing protein [Synergistaceae bacterium]|nr:ankyrin repeat domain-containing protein [Synergistaceae bacterium]
MVFSLVILANFSSASAPASAAKDDAFFRMIESDDVAGVRAAIEAGADVNARGRFGQLPLILALNHDPRIVAMLLDASADVNPRDQNRYGGLTPLFYAAHLFPGLRRDRDPAVQLANTALLLEAGADVNAREGSGQTPLIFAGTLALGIFPEAEGKLVKMLLDAGADVNARDEFGRTPLMTWVQEGSSEAVKMLLDASADVNAKDVHDDMTPLLCAASMGNPDGAANLKMLLDAGADANARANDGVSALCLASMFGRYESVAVLLDAGADVNVRVRGFAPLHMAAGLVAMENENNRDSFKERADRAISMFAVRDRTRKPPTDFLAATKLLVEAGADVDARSIEDEAPLLDSLGMNTSPRTQTERTWVGEEKKLAGKTPLEVARVVGNDEVAKYLEERGREKATGANKN